MVLWSIFSFAFSFFILWSSVLHVCGIEAIGDTDGEDDEDDSSFSSTHVGELLALLFFSLLNLGWMGFVHYSVPTALSHSLFIAAQLLFAAEFIIVLREIFAKEPLPPQKDFIAESMFFVQVIFALLYVYYCLDHIYLFIAALLG